MANAYAALTGMEAPIEDHDFEDVEGDPNADDIARISPNGLMITTGTSATTYSPDEPVIRGHMALFLTRLYKAASGSDAPDPDDAGFTDIGDRPDGEQTAINQLAALGVTTGTSATTYSPLSNVTRQQMASFVARMYRAIDELPDPAEAPGAPTGVEVAISGEDGDALDVSWTAPSESGSSDVTGYVVQWKSGDGDYSEDAQSSVDGTSAGFEDLTQGDTYTFRVAAVSDDGRSDWSDEASQSPGTVPGAVSTFAVSAGAASGTLILSWAAPADDGGTSITGYVVQWATGRDAATMTEINDGSATSYTITGLKTGVSYRVHIQAVNAAGNGAITAPADTEQTSVTPTTSVGAGTVRVVLPAASDTDGFRSGGRFAKVSWPTPTLGTGQHFIATNAFDIQRKCGTENWPATHTGGRAVSQDAVTTVAVQSLSDANVALLGGTSNPGTLMNGVECTYRVRAKTFLDKAGGTAGSKDEGENELVGAWVTGTGTPLGAPATPVEVRAEPANKSLKVSWAPAMTTDTPPKVNDGGSAITGYKIAWASPADAPIGDVTVSASSRSHTITGLTNGWAYTVTVQAINTRGPSGAASTAPDAAVTPAAVPGAPTGVRVSQPPAPAQGQTDNRGNQLIVTWTAPAGNGTGDVVGYELQRRTSATTMPQADAGHPEAVDPVHGPTNTGTRYISSTADARGTSFDYRVRAINAAGAGPWSTYASGTAAALPSAVDGTKLEIIEANGSLILTWPEAAGNGSDVTHYNVRYARNREGIEGWVSAGRVNASALPTKTIAGLSNGVPYVIGITAVNSVGSSPETQTTSNPMPTGAVAGPSSVTAVPSPMANNAGDRIDVTWSAVANVSAYKVEYLGVTDAVNPAAAWTVAAPTGDAVKTIGSEAYFDASKARKVTIMNLVTEGITHYAVRVRPITQPLIGGVPQNTAIVGVPGDMALVKIEGSPSVAPTVADLDQPEKTTTIRVTWTPASNAKTEGVTGYRITWYPTETTVVGNRGSVTVAADAKSYDITGLTAIGKEFAVVVSAVNKVGVGLAADAVMHTLTAATT